MNDQNTKNYQNTKNENEREVALADLEAIDAEEVKGGPFYALLSREHPEIRSYESGPGTLALS